MMTDPADDDPILTVRQAALRHHMDPQAIRQAIYRGRLTPVSRDPLTVRRSAIDAYAARVVGCQLTCPVCGQTFTKTSNAQVYCGSRCMNLGGERMRRGVSLATGTIPAICARAACGRSFERWTSKQRYCSNACRTAAWIAANPERFRQVNREAQVRWRARRDTHSASLVMV